MVTIGFKKCYESSQDVVSMLLVQAFATGMQLLSKVILNNGTFIFALMAYRHVVGAVCVAPFALYFERFERDNTTKLSLKVWIWLFISALTGISLAMGLFYYGLRDTTATYATNFLNMIPIVTFVFSIILRVESLRLNTRAGKVKTIGAILCVAGALTTIFYQGRSFYVNHQFSRPHSIPHFIPTKIPANWTRGTLMLVGSCLSYGIWFIVQVNLIKVFPLKYWSTMLTCIVAAAQATIVGLCIDRSKKSWSLGLNLQLITIVYSGALATAATFCLISWMIAKRGPTFPSMFNPLTLIFVSVLEALVLGAAIHVGTVAGTILIMVGIYSFLWGKTKELRMNSPAPVNDVAAMDVEAAADESTTISPPSKAMIVVPK